MPPQNLRWRDSWRVEAAGFTADCHHMMGSAIALPVVGEVNDLRLAYGSRALIMVEVRSVG